MKNDPAVVLTAIQQNGTVLEYASYEMKNDPAVVLAAIQQNGRALRFASVYIKDDPTVVLAAVQQVKLMFSKLSSCSAS